MTILKKKLLTACVGFGLTAGGGAFAADLIQINDTQLGTVEVSSFDWTPSNSLAIDSVPLASSPGTTTFDFYTQGALGNYLDSSNKVIKNTGLGVDYEITFEAGSTEIGTQLGPVALFGLDPNAAVNYFNIYYDTSQDHNVLAGTGFTNGDLILSGFMTENNTIFALNLNGNGTPTITDLDQQDGNDYDGIGTLVGFGGGSLAADITDLNQQFDFFLDDTLASLLLDLSFGTETSTPFDSTNPSALVAGFTPNYTPNTFLLTGCGEDGLEVCDYINGAFFGGDDTYDFHFLSDANNTFTRSQQVPEPGILTLLGMGLMGWGVSRRRKEAV